MMKYSPSNNAFYDPELFTPELGNLPEDAVEVSAEVHASCAGQTTRPGPDGQPTVAPPPAATGAELAKYLRQRRTFLLAASDWADGRSIDDATYAKWAPYRKALRDLPQQPGFPNTVEWPLAPDANSKQE